MITFEQKGDLHRTFNFLRRNGKIKAVDLVRYGEMGVQALKQATPKDTGLTADSWYYEIVERDGTLSINFLNSNLGDGWAPIAILIQMGHATGTGGWVEGVDYINPALKPIFDKISKDAWEEVTRT